MTIAEWSKEIHDNAVNHGWWENEFRQISEQLLNQVAELCEAWEHYRDGKGLREVIYKEDHPDKPDGFPIELADCVIRIMDTCEAIGIDLEAMIALKHEYNKTRPYRHGGKLA